MENYEKIYKEYGIDIDEAIKTLKEIKISLHCWQLDDVTGFLSPTELSGGIATTGAYPFKARNFKELTSDLDEAMKYIPGKKKINLHAIYESDDIVDVKDITIDNFKSWINYVKERNLGLDFNPTVFSSPHLVDGLSLSSPIKEVRDYWIEHVINSIKVAEKMSDETHDKVLLNIWIPDGLKEEPADRITPRERLKESLDKILEYKYDKDKVVISVESKVFGLGIESYTVGSFEFYLNYASRNGLISLLDMGHFHPTENVADKISSMLLFNDKIALHISRPVRWDSDHVVKLNDDLQAVTDEIVKNNAINRTYIALDYFDGSINRVAAMVIGARNLEKALLRSLLTPWNLLKDAQEKMDHTRLLVLEEEIKSLPWTDVWNKYLNEDGVKGEAEWYPEVMKYEKEVQSKRGE